MHGELRTADLRQRHVVSQRPTSAICGHFLLSATNWRNKVIRGILRQNLPKLSHKYIAWPDRLARLKGKKRFVLLAGKLKPESRRLFTQPFIKCPNRSSSLERRPLGEKPTSLNGEVIMILRRCSTVNWSVRRKRSVLLDNRKANGQQS